MRTGYGICGKNVRYTVQRFIRKSFATFALDEGIAIYPSPLKPVMGVSGSGF